jgi:hypothetical protein
MLNTRQRIQDLRSRLGCQSHLNMFEIDPHVSSRTADGAESQQWLCELEYTLECASLFEAALLWRILCLVLTLRHQPAPSMGDFKSVLGYGSDTVGRMVSPHA